jgi:hypothetical protein
MAPFCTLWHSLEGMFRHDRCNFPSPHHAYVGFSVTVNQYRETLNDHLQLLVLSNLGGSRDFKPSARTSIPLLEFFH